MARLVVDGTDLVVKLNPLEELGALHPRIRVPLTEIAGLDASGDLWDELRGLRLPGTGIPGVIALGTWRYADGKDFVAVYRNTGVVVRLAGSSWSRLVVSSGKPRDVCRHIDAFR